jgi:predicted ATPase/DNA-binding CsgD family transcriptional regulator
MTARHNLPAELDRFIGRERELADLQRCLATTRLLTLSGSGGGGKTRLALRLAATVVTTFPDGVWFIDLAPLTDPLRLPQVVAAVLGVREEPGQPLSETLAAALAPRALLLLLDSCEHLIEPVANLAEGLLRACPGLTILATSREPLRATGEVCWPVPPLALPPAGPCSLADLRAVESVALFVERAAARQPGFALTAANAPAVAAICRRLDGLPLALELAAALVPTLTVDQIAERLDRALDLLRAGYRTRPRHRSLTAALDWSYSLLSPAEQTVFRRLAVFPGDFRLEAAEAVCGPVLHLLEALVEKSLVSVTVRAPAARYRLLEPVRQYAAERLVASGEAPAAEAALARYIADLAAAAEGPLAGPDQPAWLARIRAEEAAVRTTLHWSIQAPERAPLGLRVATALARFWIVTGYLAEWRQWLARLLALIPPTAPGRARALMWGAAAALLQDDFPAACALAEECAAVGAVLGDPASAAEALAILACALANRGALDQAEEACRDSLAWLERLGESAALGRALMGAGVVAHLRGDDAAAVRHLAAGVACLRGQGDWYFLAHTLSNLGLVLAHQGELVQAQALFDEALGLRRRLGDRQGIAWSLKDLGDLAQRRGDLANARCLWSESLTLLEEVGDRAGRAEVLARLNALPSHSPATRRSRGPGRLTPRECEVAALVAQGFTNRQIARALVITEGTAALHVKHILHKLGLATRAQLAVWAVEQGLARRSLAG